LSYWRGNTLHCHVARRTGDRCAARCRRTMLRHSDARLKVVALIALCFCWISVPAGAQAPDLGALLMRIGERVAGYYRRAQSVICVERSTVQPIGRNLTPEGFARTVESELRIDSGPADGQGRSDATVVRNVYRINGRAPRERDNKDRSGCTDPNP